MVYSLDINYLTYTLATKDYQDDYMFTLQYMKNPPETKDYFSDIDITDRPFIWVKELQAAYIDNDTEAMYQQIISLPEYSEVVFQSSAAYKVLLTLQHIMTRVNETLKIESEMLVSKVAGEDYSGITETVDFSMFPRYYSELRELAGGDILKFKAVGEMKYSDCIVELIYRQKQSDFERLAYKQQTSRMSNR